MKLAARLARLERTAPAPDAGLDVALDPDLAQRIADAKAAGTFPASLTDADLKQAVEAIERARHDRP